VVDPILAVGATVAAMGVARVLSSDDPGTALRAFLRAEGRNRRADRQMACCQRWRAAKCLVHDHVTKIAPNQCAVPGCPSCQGAIARRRQADWERRLKIIIRHYPAGKEGRSGWHLSMLTLTMRSGRSAGEDLSPETLQRNLRKIHAAFQRLWALRLSRMGKAQGMGCVTKAEFGAAGACHLHVLFWGPWIDASWLQRQWREITGSWNTRVQWAHGRGAFAELVKYVCKPVAHAGHLLSASVAVALAGLRNFRSYGSLREWRSILGYGPAVHADRIPIWDLDGLCPTCGLLTCWAWGPWADTREAALDALADAAPRGPPGYGAEKVDPVTGEVGRRMGIAQSLRALAGSVLGNGVSMVRNSLQLCAGAADI
jgi:hypothetical protein